MEEGAKNGVVKSRNSTGCLIIKKKVDDAGGYSGPDIVYTRKEKKRPRSADSDSESSDDELLEIYRRRVGSNQVSTSGSSRMKKEIAMRSESTRKKSVDFARDDIFPPPERKMNTLDVYDFDEYDDLNEVDMGYFDTQVSGRMFGGSSRQSAMMGNRKRPFLGSSSSEKIRGSSPFDGGFGMKNKLPVPVPKERFESHSNEAIRLQGKNGVLKLMVKNKVGEPSVAEKYEEVEGSSMSRARELTPKNAMARRSVYLEPKVLNDSKNVDGVKIGKMKPRKLLPPKGDEDSDEGSEESEEPPSNFKTPRPTKRGRFEAEVTPSPESVQASKSKETKGKRGSGTEKQLLREKIRNLLVNAGWTIDYRPRRNRDYFDAVYINPTGTAYWSIIKAYDALQKQIEEDGAEAGGEKAGVSLISDDALSKLTRQTQKKLEKELKRKNRENNASKRKKKAAPGKFVDDDPETDCTDSDDSEEQKLSSFIKQSGNSKGRLHDFRNGNARIQAVRVQERFEKPSAASSHAIHGRKTKKIGRCTLLVRNADKELNSEGDSFTPYKGKRTILSWLIDSGIVKLSEKVLYMNRRRTKVMLEGWITRDGIHCGCCSKILTVSKFELHAGSKLRQPYQNICLPSGVSLLQCQVNAWNSQDDPQRTGFNRIDVDGDDPNDDTCGICGDGGNLICCDGCPSTFHQSCLGIEMLPPDDWHCPHCSCKFCGLADVDTSESDENTSNELVGCSLCNRKYHKACIPEMDSMSSNSSNQISFCGRKCQELFERLQKLLGAKHDLESGLSWSLIHRNDLEADPSHRSFSQKVEWNAKLAVSLTVMVECFLPIIDRRSGINLIQNVLYNCRIHGNQLAEMPFIGTRHIYRRQGMCRRLLVAIERALRSLKVEKLIIPAISDMMHTWTNVFSFSALEESQKQEMKSLNMLVFPGTDMLQKKLLQQVASNKDVAACKGTDLCKDEGGSSPMPDLTKGSSAETSPSESAGDALPNPSIEKHDVPENDYMVEKSDPDPNLQNSGVPLNAESLHNMVLDAPSDKQEPMECKVSQEAGSLSDSEDKLAKSVPSDVKVDNLPSSTECGENDKDENTVEVAHSGSEAVDGSIVGIPDLVSDVKKPSSFNANHNTLSMGKPECDSPVENDAQVLEVDTTAPSENGDKNPEADFASKPVATSPMMVDPCLDDTAEFKPLTKSTELDTAIEDSIEPMSDFDVKTYSGSTLEPSVATLIPSACSDGINEHVIQAEEANRDSSNSGNIQNLVELHVDCERHPASEVKATEANSLLEAPAVFSNGTSVSISDNINEPRSFSPVQAVDHSQTEEQLAVPVPAAKHISILSTEHESNGVQTDKSFSSIEEMTLKPIENKEDGNLENIVEVAGLGLAHCSPLDDDRDRNSGSNAGFLGLGIGVSELLNMTTTFDMVGLSSA
ncbi:hypothetical protein V2J09_011436 [Rumex salicifolius]